MTVLTVSCFVLKFMPRKNFNMNNEYLKGGYISYRKFDQQNPNITVVFQMF